MVTATSSIPSYYGLLNPAAAKASSPYSYLDSLTGAKSSSTPKLPAPSSLYSNTKLDPAISTMLQKFTQPKTASSSFGLLDMLYGSKNSSNNSLMDSINQFTTSKVFSSMQQSLVNAAYQGAAQLSQQTAAAKSPMSSVLAGYQKYKAIA